MNKRTAEYVVGATCLAAILILGIYTIVLRDFRFFAETKKYLVDFNEVYGLTQGDVVRVEGREMGRVISLRLLPLEDIDPRAAGKVRAVIEVEGEVEIFRDASFVRVQPFSPLGGRVVEINRGRPGPRGRYTPFDYEGLTPADADVIPGEAEGELLQTLNALVEENRDDVRKIVANLERVSDRLTRTDNVIGYVLNDRDARDNLARATDGMSSAAQRLDRILGRVEAGDGVVGGLLKEGTELEHDVKGAASAARGSLEGLSTILTRADQGESALGVLVGKDLEARDAVKGIVTDVGTISEEVAAGRGTLGKLVKDDRLYEGVSGTAENLRAITGRIDAGEGILAVLSEEEAGEHVRQTLRNVASITDAVNDPEAGTVGLLIHDDVLRGRLARIAQEVEGLVVEFRDTLEDAREQAPLNAFIGAVFAAF